MSGWTTKKLGEVCTFRRGLTYSKGDEVEHSSKVVLRANNISLEKNQLCFDELKFIRDDFEIPDDKYLEKDCVLICTASGSKAHLGKVAYIDKEYDFAFGGFMGLIVPDVSLVFSRYFYYVLTAENYRQFIQRLTDGANINNLKFSQLAEFDIPIPPLAEQKRIVAKIDAAFEKIDRLKANAEKNLANAKELSQSALDEAMRPKKGWVEKRLGEIGSCKNGLNFKRAAEGEKIDIVGVGDFKKGLVVDDATELERLTLQELPEHEWYLQPNDIVFVRSNGSKALVGRAVIIKAKRPLTFSGFCIRYRIEDKCIDPDYLARIVSVESFRKTMLSGRNATTINNVTQPILLSQVISIPSLAEQKQIVNRLDFLSQKLETLQQNYARQVADCAEMRQAILREAFEGRL